jgi:hypothetical protein
VLNDEEMQRVVEMGTKEEEDDHAVTTSDEEAESNLDCEYDSSVSDTASLLPNHHPHFDPKQKRTRGQLARDTGSSSGGAVHCSSSPTPGPTNTSPGDKSEPSGCKPSGQKHQPNVGCATSVQPGSKAPASCSVDDGGYVLLALRDMVTTAEGQGTKKPAGRPLGHTMVKCPTTHVVTTELQARAKVEGKSDQPPLKVLSSGMKNRGSHFYTSYRCVFSGCGFRGYVSPVDRPTGTLWMARTGAHTCKDTKRSQKASSKGRFIQDRSVALLASAAFDMQPMSDYKEFYSNVGSLWQGLFDQNKYERATTKDSYASLLKRRLRNALAKLRSQAYNTETLQLFALRLNHVFSGGQTEGCGEDTNPSVYILFMCCPEKAAQAVW